MLTSPYEKIKKLEYHRCFTLMPEAKAGDNRQMFLGVSDKQLLFTIAAI